MTDKNNTPSETVKLSKEEKQAQELADKKQTYLDYAETYRKKLQAEKERAARRAEREMMRKGQDSEKLNSQTKDATEEANAAPEAAHADLTKSDNTVRVEGMSIPPSPEAVKASKEAFENYKKRVEEYNEAYRKRTEEYNADHKRRLDETNAKAKKDAESYAEAYKNSVAQQRQSVIDFNNKMAELQRRHIASYMDAVARTRAEADRLREDKARYNDELRELTSRRNAMAKDFREKKNQLQREIDDYNIKNGKINEVLEAARAEADKEARLREAAEAKILELQRENERLSMQNSQLAIGAAMGTIPSESGAPSGAAPTKAEIASRIREGEEARLEMAVRLGDVIAAQKSSDADRVSDLVDAIGIKREIIESIADDLDYLRVSDASEEQIRRISEELNDSIREYNNLVDDYKEFTGHDLTRPEANMADKILRGETVRAIPTVMKKNTLVSKETGEVVDAASPEAIRNAELVVDTVKDGVHSSYTPKTLDNKSEILITATAMAKQVVPAELKRCAAMEKVYREKLAALESASPTSTEESVILTVEKIDVRRRLVESLARDLKLSVRIDDKKRIASYKKQLNAAIADYNSSVDEYYAVTGDKLTPADTDMAEKIMNGKPYRSIPIISYHKESIDGEVISEGTPFSATAGEAYDLIEPKAKRRLAKQRIPISAAPTAISGLSDRQAKAMLAEEKKRIKNEAEAVLADSRINELQASEEKRLAKGATSKEERAARLAAAELLYEKSLEKREEAESKLVEAKAIKTLDDYQAYLQRKNEKKEKSDALAAALIPAVLSDADKAKEEELERKRALFEEFDGLSKREQKARIMAARTELLTEANALKDASDANKAKAEAERLLAKEARTAKERRAHKDEARELLSRAEEEKKLADEKRREANGLKKGYKDYLARQVALAELELKDEADALAHDADNASYREDIEAEIAAYKRYSKEAVASALPLADVPPKEAESRMKTERARLAKEAALLAMLAKADERRAAEYEKKVQLSNTEAERLINALNAELFEEKGAKEAIDSKSLRKKSRKLVSLDEYEKYLIEKKEGTAASLRESSKDIADEAVLAEKELEEYREVKALEHIYLPLAGLSRREAKALHNKERELLKAEVSAIEASAAYDTRCAGYSRDAAKLAPEGEMKESAIRDAENFEQSARNKVVLAADLRAQLAAVSTLDKYEDYLINNKIPKTQKRLAAECGVSVSPEEAFESIRKELLHREKPLRGVKRSEFKFMLGSERDSIRAQAKAISSSAKADARSARDILLDVRENQKGIIEAEARTKAEILKRQSDEKEATALVMALSAGRLKGKKAYEAYLNDQAAYEAAKLDMQEIDTNVTAEDARFIPYDTLSKSEIKAHIRKERAALLRESEELDRQADNVAAEAKRIRDAILLIGDNEAKDERESAAMVLDAESEQLRDLASENLLLAESFRSVKAYKKLIDSRAHMHEAPAQISDGEEQRAEYALAMNEQELSAAISETRVSLAKDAAALDAAAVSDECEAEYTKHLAKKEKNREARIEMLALAAALTRRSSAKKELSKEKILEAKSLRDAKSYENYLYNKATREVDLYSYEANRIIESKGEPEDISVLKNVSSYEANLMMEKEKSALKKNADALEYSARQDDARAKELKLLARNERRSYERNSKYEKALGLTELAAKKREEARRMRTSMEELSSIEAYEKYLEEKTILAGALIKSSKAEEPKKEAVSKKGKKEEKLTRRETLQRMLKERNEILAEASRLDLEAKSDRELAKKFKREAADAKNYHAKTRSYEQALALEASAERKLVKANEKRAIALELRDAESYESYLKSKGIIYDSLDTKEKRTVEKETVKEALSASELKEMIKRERKRLKTESDALAKESRVEKARAEAMRKEASGEEDESARVAKYESASIAAQSANEKCKNAVRLRIDAESIKTVADYERYLAAKEKTTLAYKTTAKSLEKDDAALLGSAILGGLSKEKIAAKMETERYELRREADTLEAEAKAEKARADVLRKLAKEAKNSAEASSKSEQAKSHRDLAEIKQKAAIEKRIDAESIKDIISYEKYLDKKAAIQRGETENTVAYDKKLEKDELLGAMFLAGLSKEEAYKRMKSERESLVKDAGTLEAEAVEDNRQADEAKERSEKSTSKLEAAKYHEKYKSLKENSESKRRAAQQKREEAASLSDIASYERYLDRKSSLAYSTLIKEREGAFEIDETVSAAYDKDMQRRELLGALSITGLTASEIYDRMQRERNAIIRDAMKLEAESRADRARADALRRQAAKDEDKAEAAKRLEALKEIERTADAKLRLSITKHNDAMQLSDIAAYERYLDGKASIAHGKRISAEKSADALKVSDAELAAYEREMEKRECLGAMALSGLSIDEVKSKMAHERKALERDAGTLEEEAKADKSRSDDLLKRESESSSKLEAARIHSEAKSLSELSEAKLRAAKEKRAISKALTEIRAYENYLDKKAADAYSVRLGKQRFDDSSLADNYEREMQRRELLGAVSLSGLSRDAVYERMKSEREGLVKDAMTLEAESSKDRSSADEARRQAKEKPGTVEAREKNEEAKRLEELSEAKIRAAKEKRREVTEFTSVAAYEKYLDRKAALAYSRAYADDTKKAASSAALGAVAIKSLFKEDVYAMMQKERAGILAEALRLENEAKSEKARLAALKKHGAQTADTEEIKAIEESATAKYRISEAKRAEAKRLVDVAAYERYLDAVSANEHGARLEKTKKNVIDAKSIDTYEREMERRELLGAVVLSGLPKKEALARMYKERADIIEEISSLESEIKADEARIAALGKKAAESKNAEEAARMHEDARNLKQLADAKYRVIVEKRNDAESLADIAEYEKYLDRRTAIAYGRRIERDAFVQKTKTAKTVNTASYDKENEKRELLGAMALSGLTKDEAYAMMLAERRAMLEEANALVAEARADKLRVSAVTDAEEAKRLDELANAKQRAAYTKQKDAELLTELTAYERYLDKKAVLAYDKLYGKEVKQEIKKVSLQKKTEPSENELLGSTVLSGLPKKEIQARMLYEREAIAREAFMLEAEARADKARAAELVAMGRYDEARRKEELAVAKYRISAEKHAAAKDLVKIAAYEKYLDRKSALAYGRLLDKKAAETDTAEKEIVASAGLLGTSRNEAYARMQAERTFLREEAKRLELAAREDKERAAELRTLARFEKNAELAELARANARALAERGATKRIVASQRKQTADNLNNLKEYEKYLDSKAEKSRFIDTYNEISAAYEKEMHARDAVSASGLELLEGARRERASLVAEANALEASARVDAQRAKESKALAKYEKSKYEREAKLALAASYAEKSRAKRTLADEKRQVADSFKSVAAYEKYLENKELLAAAKKWTPYASDSVKSTGIGKGDLKAEMLAERKRISDEASALQLAALEDYQRSKELRAFAKSEKNKSARQVKKNEADALERRSAAKKVLADEKRNTLENLKSVEAYEAYLKEKEILDFSGGKKPLNEATDAYDAYRRQSEEKVHLALTAMSAREQRARMKSERYELQQQARELESSARIDEYRAKEERNLAKNATRSSAKMHEKLANDLDASRVEKLNEARAKQKTAKELKSVKALEKYLAERDMKRAIEDRRKEAASKEKRREVIARDKYEKYLAVREEIQILKSENERVLGGKLTKQEQKARLLRERYELAMESERLQRDGLDELRLAKAKKNLARRVGRAERAKLLSEILEHENYYKTALELSKTKEKEAKRIAKDTAAYEKYLQQKSAAEAIKLERVSADIDRRLESVRPEEIRMDMEKALKTDSAGEPIIEFDKSATMEQCLEQSERDEHVVVSRIETKIAAIKHQISVDKLHFGDKSPKSHRQMRSNKRLLKKLRHRLVRAVRAEIADNRRYYALASVDIDKLKLPKDVKRDEILTLKARLEGLLKERDDINKELIILYEGNSSYENNGVSYTERRMKKASRKAKRAYKKQCKLANQIEELRIPVGEKMKVFEPMNRITSLSGEIASLEYQLKREKLTKRARQNAKRKLKSKVRIRKKLEIQVQRTAGKVKRKAARRELERRQQITAIIVVAAIALAAIFGYTYRAEIISYLKGFLGGGI